MSRLSHIFGSKKSHKYSNQSKLRLFESLEKREMMSVTPLYYASAPIQPATSQQVTVANNVTTNLTPQGTLQLASTNFLPALSSRLGASATLYLDFDGFVQENINAPDRRLPAFDIDGNPDDFLAERSSIREIWARVAEDYSPFNINVTTVDPGDFSHGSMNLRVVITGEDYRENSNDGGFGAVNAFSREELPNVVYVFSISDGTGEDDPAGVRPLKSIGNLVSHEAGHAFGLEHYSLIENGEVVGEYDTGDINKAPLMGNANGSERGIWWKGTNKYGDFQDDMAIIASTINGFGESPDGKDSFATAGQLVMVGDHLQATGVIHHMSDWDVYRFDTSGGEISVTARIARTEGTVGEIIGNLDAVLELYNSQDLENPVQRDANEGNLEPGIFTTVPAGTYYVKIGSQGAYGDVGQYTIEVDEWSGPRVIASSQVSLGANLAGVWFTFNKAIDASTFTTADVGVTGGIAQSVTADVNDPRRFLVTVALTTNTAYWSVTIGPNIKDLFGVPMNQDQDNNEGGADDVYRADFFNSGPGTLYTTKTTTRTTTLTPRLVDAAFAS